MYIGETSLFFYLIAFKDSFRETTIIKVGQKMKLVQKMKQGINKACLLSLPINNTDIKAKPSYENSIQMEGIFYL